MCESFLYLLNIRFTDSIDFLDIYIDFAISAIEASVVSSSPQHLLTCLVYCFRPARFYSSSEPRLDSHTQCDICRVSLPCLLACDIITDGLCVSTLFCFNCSVYKRWYLCSPSYMDQFVCLCLTLFFSIELNRFDS